MMTSATSSREMFPESFSRVYRFTSKQIVRMSKDAIHFLIDMLNFD